MTEEFTYEPPAKIVVEIVTVDETGDPDEDAERAMPPADIIAAIALLDPYDLEDVIRGLSQVYTGRTGQLPSMEAPATGDVNREWRRTQRPEDPDT
jgi:hypothetical protein